MDIIIEREERGDRGRYVAHIGKHDAELTYVRIRRKGRTVIVADHTGVPRPLEGQGIGLALVQRAVEDAITEGAKIAPLCSFVRVHMQRNKDWRELIADTADLD